MAMKRGGPLGNVNAATHGWYGTPEYQAWIDLRRRCNEPTVKNYHLYGGRGIRVCPEWDTSFVSFLRHVGPRPTPEHSIHRIENDGHYEPGNVKWATREEQGRNRQTNLALTLDGRTLCLVEWSEATGISTDTIKKRLMAGWSVRKALTTRVRWQQSPRRWSQKP